MATVSRMPVPVRRTDSDVSPKTIIPPQDSPRGDTKADYFPDSNTVDGSNTSVRASDDDSSAHKSSISFAPDPRPDRSSSRESNQKSTQNQDTMVQRKSSTGSVSFRRMTNPKLPQGMPQQMSNSRIRASSPDHKRFQKHVAFDNVPTGEPTKNNAISFTLNVRHMGYQARRRSRCFMVGVDEHAYSDYALQWLLEELVDDGDEVVCVRVVEKDMRYSNREYREDAQKVMRGILDRNGNNRAINIVLEYAVGKLHTTFQVLIQMYQPAMLIVGTRGRTLGGLQGLVNTRNSFSKYCLQYSPVPVVVVRPTEKRVKKKSKRANDSSRQTYVSMLAATSGKHEADSEASSTYELEIQNSPDEEAHQVARALGLPASFDPTIKPFNHGQALNVKSQGPATASSPGEATENRRLVKDDASAAGESDDDDDDDESDNDSGEFEVVSGQQALDQEKLKQLHKMEVGEAEALKKKVDDDLDDEDDTPSAQKGTDNKQGVSGDEGLEYADKDSHQQVKQSTTQPPRERVSRIPILCNSPRVTPNRFEDAGKVSQLSRIDKDGIELQQVDGCQDHATGPPESNRLRDIDSPEHSPEMDRGLMESETASGVIKDFDVEDGVIDESSGENNDTTNNSLGNENRLSAYTPVWEQRSSMDLEAQDQPGRVPRGGSGGEWNNENNANGNADGDRSMSLAACTCDGFLEVIVNCILECFGFF
ncbi:hypothetical protein FPOAC1_002695 [Fusarium poae]|uniref:hypothetical protein n=1 Tax=Fusarium poae TaxID=36050 RepID=UPI001CEAF1A6|nr:hypothetical protein FPOAC1_002695 [Fusarium poae]KAG8676688.1 hypothetical protein FPOAC1_002695 [Fusarium poae]